MLKSAISSFPVKSLARNYKTNCFWHLAAVNHPLHQRNTVSTLTYNSTNKERKYLIKMHKHSLILSGE